MHVPIKVDYGVRALVYLAINGKDAPIRASEIAASSAVPQPYLAQVLHTLNKNGIIQSQRGPQGGHSLAKSPSEIRLSRVMACLGGTETPVRRALAGGGLSPSLPSLVPRPSTSSG